MPLTRREVLWLGGLGPLACGEPDSGGDAETCSGAVDVEINNDHGHQVTVPVADVEAGTARTYVLAGSADHTHELAVSAADFAKLREDGQVGVRSEIADGHDHQVLLFCE